MNIEKYVVSLELAKKLKELGVSQKTLFYHYNEPYVDNTDDWVITNWSDYETAYSNKSEPYSAFLASELLSIIKAFLRISTDIDEPIKVYYQPENGTDNSYTFEGNNIADLLAEVLIAQIKEGEFNFGGSK